MANDIFLSEGKLLGPDGPVGLDALADSATYVSEVDGVGDLPDPTLHAGKVYVYEVSGALHGSKSDGTNWVEVLSPAEYLNEANSIIVINADGMQIHSGSPTLGAVASTGGERGYSMPPTGTSELTAPGRTVPSYWGSFDVYLQWAHTAAAPTGTLVTASLNRIEHVVGAIQSTAGTSVTQNLTAGAQYELMESLLMSGVVNNGGQHRFRVTRNGDGANDDFSVAVFYQRLVLKRAS